MRTILTLVQMYYRYLYLGDNENHSHRHLYLGDNGNHSHPWGTKKPRYFYLGSVMSISTHPIRGSQRRSDRRHGRCLHHGLE